MAVNQPVVENQFFIGVPWKHIRPKFEKAIKELQKEYPVHCVVFGRNTGQDADDLWNSIQKEIQASAATIFDVTGSNPNVALEFGYVEALGKKRVVTRYERKPRKRQSSPAHSSSIMSDLAGKIRSPYKNTKALKSVLQKEFDRNPYVVRFKRSFPTSGGRKRQRKIAIAAVHELGGGKRISKPILILNLQSAFPNMKSVDIPDLVDRMAEANLLVIKRGRHGGVCMPKVT